MNRLPRARARNPSSPLQSLTSDFATQIAKSLLGRCKLRGHDIGPKALSRLLPTDTLPAAPCAVRL